MLSQVSVVKTDFETFIFSYCSMVKPKAFIKYLGTGITTGITVGVGITILVAKYYETMREPDSHHHNPVSALFSSLK